MKLKKNNKAYSFLDTVIALFILLFVIIVMFNFKIYLKKINIAQEQKIILYQVINNTIMQSYDENFEYLKDSIIETKYGNIYITLSSYNRTLYETEKITFIFRYLKYEKKYDIEKRKEFHENK